MISNQYHVLLSSFNYTVYLFNFGFARNARVKMTELRH